MRKFMIAAMLLFCVSAKSQTTAFFKTIKVSNGIYLAEQRLDSISRDTNFTYPSNYNAATTLAIATYVKNLIANNTVSTLPWSSVTGKPNAGSLTDGILLRGDWLAFNGKQTALNGTGLVRMSGTSVSYDNTSYYPMSGGNLSAGAYIGLPNISTPSTPSSGIYLYSDASGRFTWLTNLGYSRTFRSVSLSGNRIYTLQDRDGKLMDSTDLAGKETSISYNGTTKKYWNGYKQWAALNSDSCTEGAGNLYFTNARVNTQMNTYTGDIIFNNGNAALGNFNSNVGAYGGGAKTIKLTANSKGLVTAVSDTAIQIAESQVTNLVSDLGSKIGGTASSGQVAYFNATSTLAGSNNFQWDNTNTRLGIGTTPSYRVHTKGADTLAATTQLMVDNSLGQHLFSITNDGSVNISRSAVYAYTNAATLPSLNISPTIIDSAPAANTSYSLLNISPTVSIKNGGSSNGFLNISPSLTKVVAGSINLTGSLFSSSANYTSFSFVNYAGIKLTPTYTSVSNLGSAVGHNFGFNFSPTLTSSGGNATYIGGFNYDPSLGAAFINSNIAFRNTSGDCFFGTTTGNVSIGATTSIATCAVAQITSTTKGLLLPRMTKTQRDAISSPLAGLMIYQTDNTAGLRVYNGTNWIKYSETTD